MFTFQCLTCLWTLHTCHTVTSFLSVGYSSGTQHRLGVCSGESVRTYPTVCGSVVASQSRRARLRAKRSDGLPFPCRYQTTPASTLSPTSTAAITIQGNVYTVLFTHDFSRRGDIYAATEAQFLASNTANILVDRYTLSGDPRSHSSSTVDYSSQYRGRPHRQLHFSLGIPGHTSLQPSTSVLLQGYPVPSTNALALKKTLPASYYPSTNSSVKRVNHIMAQILDVMRVFNIESMCAASAY